MKLIIEDDEGRRTVIPLFRDVLTIGRAEGNNVRLTEKDVSRQHGRLVRDDGHFYIEDAGSFTGIRVNGEKIRGRRVVGDGDLIQISEFDLHLQASPDDRAARRQSAAPARAPLDTPAPRTLTDARRLGPRRSRAAAVASLAVLAALAVAVWLLGRARQDDGVVEVKQDRAVVNGALQAADQAFAAHRFDEAVRYLERARGAGATAEELRSLNRAHDEAEAEARFRELEAAIAAHDVVRARALLDELSRSGTFYGGEAASKGREVSSLEAPPSKVAAASLAPGPDVEREAKRLLEEGNQKLRAQDLGAAVKSFERAVAIGPTGPLLANLYRSLGIAYTRQGLVDEGARYYRLYLPLCTNPQEKRYLEKMLDEYEARHR